MRHYDHNFNVVEPSWGKILTCGGAVVGDEAGHVDRFVVDAQVSHAAHEVSVPDREVLG